jgi:hypothetical protein
MSAKLHPRFQMIPIFMMMSLANVEERPPHRGPAGECIGPDTADCLPGLAECFQDKANLVAQACFDIFAVLNAVLDQNRVEEWHKRGSDRSRGFRGIVDVELARFDALAYDRLEDRHHPLDVRLDDRPVLLRSQSGRACAFL